MPWSVRTFAEKVGSEDKLNLLVNNAGAMAVPSGNLRRMDSKCSWETNFLGTVALTGLLRLCCGGQFRRE
jgi:NAD(P)-dependent dehydrogenase (short-subunit alcohol dehydrogenase family)